MFYGFWSQAPLRSFFHLDPEEVMASGPRCSMTPKRHPTACTASVIPHSSEPHISYDGNATIEIYADTPF